jgi:molybdopterin molybdotransferase
VRSRATRQVSQARGDAAAAFALETPQETRLAAAVRAVLDACRPLAAVEHELDAALGSVLAEDLGAPSPLPPFDSSAMDGVAVRAGDVAGARADAPVSLRVVDESAAGRPARAAVGAGEAVWISTGAEIPAGADAVVRRESTRIHARRVEVLRAARSGENIRRAGEDVRAGARVLARGTLLGPAQLGMLASLGRARVRCARAPAVSVLVTGDELIGAGQPLRAGAIHDSNSHSVGALARCEGAHVVRSQPVGDSFEATRGAIEAAAADSDVLVVCGGVSVGRHDHVRPALGSLGAERAFWGLALRPGHPTWFGRLGDTLVFGLPGNPVSAMVTFSLLAAPALRALQGRRERGEPLHAALDEGYEKAPGRVHALRCRLERGAGGWRARLTGPQGSHVLSSMLDAEALALVAAETTRVQAGEQVPIEPLPMWSRPRC